MRKQHRRGITQKGGLGQFADLRGGLTRKWGGVFEEGFLMHTREPQQYKKKKCIYKKNWPRTISENTSTIPRSSF